MKEEANPRGAWTDPLPNVWIMLCSVMLLVLLNRWAEATLSSLSASEPALLSPSKAFCASVKEKEGYFTAQCTSLPGAGSCSFCAFKLALALVQIPVKAAGMLSRRRMRNRDYKRQFGK